MREILRNVPKNCLLNSLQDNDHMTVVVSLRDGAIYSFDYP